MSHLPRTAAAGPLLAPVLLVLALPALAQNQPLVDFETQIRRLRILLCL